MAQGIDRRVDFGALPFLVPVKPCSATTLWSRLQRSTVHNDGTGLLVPIQRQPQHRSQIVGHRFEAPGFEPAVGLLENNIPRREVVGHHSPRAAGPDKPAQPIKHFPQQMVSLRRVLFHQCQVRSTRTPLFITHITRIALSIQFHPELNARMYLQCTDVSLTKLITASRLLLFLCGDSREGKGEELKSSYDNTGVVAVAWGVVCGNPEI